MLGNECFVPAKRSLFAFWCHLEADTRPTLIEEPQQYQRWPTTCLGMAGGEGRERGAVRKEEKGGGGEKVGRGRGGKGRDSRKREEKEEKTCKQEKTQTHPNTHVFKIFRTKKNLLDMSG